MKGMCDISELIATETFIVISKNKYIWELHVIIKIFFRRSIYGSV